ncbi:two-component regulator propeller domain-containing protein [Lewinella sp. 4G2]|uniref:type IX secretion system anionic LPS delivery protein PorZ n=1 Tax=Lewinella sp. 4G2 TaxID=1803372 RepID=UPI0007B4D097|nr:two-component regulator propeller domain-containing protein [Lewinella sp. 4G2]OAV43319.1 hypothetical protein A3850_001880 [Lewinella sp. 4G2]
MLKRFLPCLFLALALLPCTRGSAQTDSIGQWRTLQSFRFGAYVTESEDDIIYSSGRAIFYLDKEDLSIRTLTRDNGLAETRVRIVRYHRPTETLVIVYESGVIDLLRNNRFSTLRQIDNFNFNGDKTIYDIFFGEDDVAYISAGFGLTALDLNEETFLFTTFTGIRVNAAAQHEGRLYAATDEGMYRVQQAGTNLNDFGNWELLGPTNDFPGDYLTSAVNVFKGQLYFGIDEDIYRLENDRANRIFDTDPDPNYRLQYLSAGPNYLLGGYACQDDNCSRRQVAILNENGLRDIIFGCLFRTNNAIEDEQGRVWFGEQGTDFIRYVDDVFSEDCNRLEYPGPLTDRNFRLLHDGNALWVAPAVLNENFGPSFFFGGAYRLLDNSWNAFNRNNVEAFLGRDGQPNGNDDVATIVDVHYDPVGNAHWFSSFYEGVIRFDEASETGELYDEFNSTLSNAIGESAGRVRVAGVVTDPQGFNYFANSGADDGNIISVRSPDGEWADLGGDCDLNVALSIEIDDSGFLWVIHATSDGGGITVLDVNGTPMDPSDDRCRTILSSNSRLPTNSVRSVTVDQRGVVWVGTAEGIILFECGSEVFNTANCTGRLPVATAEDDFNGFLLQTEEIRSITVDGGNQKWVGTLSGGVYLLSPDGDEQILNFTSGNSPLLDNLVRDIAIDPETGTVYFGTDLGIISWRGEATAPSAPDFRDPFTIFPNPVEPGYDGPIAINGLVRDARVKITDLSGKLVDEGTATGGQYVWNGRDYNGRSVTSGVYLVFASSNARFGIADPKSAVGKIVIVR